MWEPEEQVITALLKAYCAIEEPDDSERTKIGKLLKDGYGIDLVLLKKPSPAKHESATHLVKSTRRATADAEERVEKVKDMTDLSVKELSIAAETKRRNKIEIVETVQRLRTEYHVDIPRQIAAGVSDTERKLLTVRLMNVKNLLEHGYRVGLTEDENTSHGIVESKSPVRARVIPFSPTAVPSRTKKR